LSVINNTLNKEKSKILGFLLKFRLGAKTLGLVTQENAIVGIKRILFGILREFLILGRN